MSRATKMTEAEAVWLRLLRMSGAVSLTMWITVDWSICVYVYLDICVCVCMSKVCSDMS